MLDISFTRLKEGIEIGFIEDLVPWLFIGGGLLLFSGTARAVAGIFVAGITFLLTLILTAFTILKPLFSKIWERIKDLSNWVDRQF